MNLTLKLANFTSLEKKNIYFIIFLPISLFTGSLIANINILAIIFIFFLDCHKDKNFFFLKEKNFYLLVVFNVYLVFNSLITGINEDSLIRAFGFLRYIILAYAIYYYLNVNNKKYENIIFKFWTYIFIIVTLDCIFEYVFGYNTLKFKSNYMGRLASFTGDELKIGAYYFAFILISLIFIKNYNNKIFYISFIIFIVVSLLIGERSNFIKVIFISLFFLLFIKNISIKKKFIYIFVIILGSSFIILNSEKFKNIFFYPIINLFTFEFDPAKNKHICHYSSAIKIFKNYPLFGVGVKKYRIESNKQIYKVQVDDKNSFVCNQTHPHQLHFELLAELGIIGYILFITYFILFIYKSFKKHKNNNDEFAFGSTLFILASILPLLPSGSFFTTYTATLFWINYSIALRNLKELN